MVSQSNVQSWECSVPRWIGRSRERALVSTSEKCECAGTYRHSKNPSRGPVLLDLHQLNIYVHPKWMRSTWAPENHGHGTATGIEWPRGRPMNPQSFLAGSETKGIIIRISSCFSSRHSTVFKQCVQIECFPAKAGAWIYRQIRNGTNERRHRIRAASGNYSLLYTFAYTHFRHHLGRDWVSRQNGLWSRPYYSPSHPAYPTERVPESPPYKRAVGLGTTSDFRTYFALIRWFEIRTLLNGLEPCGWVELMEGRVCFTTRILAASVYLTGTQACCMITKTLRLGWSSRGTRYTSSSGGPPAWEAYGDQSCFAIIPETWDEGWRSTVNINGRHQDRSECRDTNHPQSITHHNRVFGFSDRQNR